MLWFVSIALALYSLIHVYIILRVKYLLVGYPDLYRWVFWILVIFILMYPVGRILESFADSGIFKLMVHIGSFWIAVMAYLVISLLLLDIITLIFKISSVQLLSQPKINLIIFLSLISTIFIAVVIGNINANTIHIKHQDIEIRKPELTPGEIKIALITDIHLGTIIRNSYLKKIVDKTNSQNPDLILLGGDIVDEDVNTVIRQNMDQILKDLKAPLGTWAITGNHEFISRQADAMEEYLKRAGITMLRDSTAMIDSNIVLVGREDRAAYNFKRYSRKSLNSLLNGIDPTKHLIILMDHQPFHLQEAEMNQVDIQVSGHTHHGQFFPFNGITNIVYEKSWGYHRRGDTHYYVSCGAGTWGPRVRLGNRPEIVILHVKINN
ncbi:MAG: metallophosphoesterase [Calditrichia bacterium]